MSFLTRLVGAGRQDDSGRGNGQHGGRTKSSSQIDGSRVTRLLVIGETQTGKSLLIQRLTSVIFASDQVEKRHVGPLSSSSHTCSGPAASDPGATIGFSVEVLKRNRRPLTESATPGAARSILDSYTTSALQRGMQMTQRGSPAPPLATAVESTLPTASPYSAGFSQSVQEEVVEFYEIGGTHHFNVDSLFFGLSQLPFDGVLMVYSRWSAESAALLGYWHAKLLASQRSYPTTDSQRPLPRILLVGTSVGALPTALRGGPYAGVSSSTSSIPDEAFGDGNFLSDMGASATGNVYRTPGDGQAFPNNSVLTQTFYQLGFYLSLLSHPEVALSEGGAAALKGDACTLAREGGDGRDHVRRIFFAFLQFFASFVVPLRHAVSLVMAIVLFGPYQEIVSLVNESPETVFRRIRNDPNYYGRIEVDVTDNVMLAATMDPLLRFIDEVGERTT